MPAKDDFYPKWCEQEAPAHSFRSLIKYGDPKGFKHPNEGMFHLLKETFQMSDQDFQNPDLCMEDFDVDVPVKMPVEQMDAIKSMVGSGNAYTDTYNRTRTSYGGGMIDALRLRHKVVENLPDIVVTRATRKTWRRL